MDTECRTQASVVLGYHYNVSLNGLLDVIRLRLSAVDPIVESSPIQCTAIVKFLCCTIVNPTYRQWWMLRPMQLAVPSTKRRPALRNISARPRTPTPGPTQVDTETVFVQGPTTPALSETIG